MDAMTETMPLLDSSEILKIIDSDETLHELYAELGKATPHGNQAEREKIKALILKLYQRHQNVCGELWDYKAALHVVHARPLK
jgi:hypothetical protein